MITYLTTFKNYSKYTRMRYLPHILMYTNSIKGIEPLMRAIDWANKEEKNLPERHAALVCPVIR